MSLYCPKREYLSAKDLSQSPAHGITKLYNPKQAHIF